MTPLRDDGLFPEPVATPSAPSPLLLPSPLWISEPLSVIRQHAIAAMLDLFDAYDTPLTHTSSGEEPLPDAPCHELIEASIAYTADGLHGSLLMLTTVPMMRTWRSALVEGPTDESLCDALGEFSNMLLGRFKNRLLAHGVVLWMATPTSAIGRDMRLLSPSGGASLWQRFDDDRGTVHVRLDLTFKPRFAMVERHAIEVMPAMPEGELLLF